MSLHRVLPVPPALSDRSLAQRWGAGPDTLEGARIMTEKRPSTAHRPNPQVSTPPQQKSPSPTDIRKSTPSQDSAEDCPSPPTTHPTPAPRKRGSISWDQTEAGDDEAAASSIVFASQTQKFQDQETVCCPSLFVHKSSHKIGEPYIKSRYSFHTLSSTLSSISGRLKSWACQSSDFESHWRPLAKRPGRRQKPLEALGRGKLWLLIFPYFECYTSDIYHRRRRRHAIKSNTLAIGINPESPPERTVSHLHFFSTTHLTTRWPAAQSVEAVV